MKFSTILTFVFVGFMVSCSSDSTTNDGWAKIVREKKTVDNITYYFSSTIDVDRRNAAIKECQQSVIDNLQLINETEFTNQMEVEFLASRKEMLKYTGMGAQGMAFPDRNTFFTLLKDKGSPIKHEMMHMITTYKWGSPPRTSTWMNEGLATYAGGICFDYSFLEIYRYFMQSGKLIPMDELAHNFFGHSDIISYTQSAFISKFLIDNYGIEKFKQLWGEGFEGLETVYGFSKDELERDLATYVMKEHPGEVEFDWEEFNKGC